MGPPKTIDAAENVGFIAVVAVGARLAVAQLRRGGGEGVRSGSTFIAT